ncbi:MAG: substrate-binding domain-containing protein [Pseudomonadota bacterium]
MHKTYRIKFLSFFILYIVNLSFCFGDKLPLTIAVSTSIEASGLIDHLKQKILNETDLDLRFIISGSGQILEMAKNGDVHVTLTHAPALEQVFVQQGFAQKRHVFMWNHYVIIGPANDPANIKGFKDPVNAFLKIYNKKALFISRGDTSGTHQKEKEMWKRASQSPNVKSDWYLESGSSQSANLRLANELQAYALSDYASFIRLKDQLDLIIMNAPDQHFDVLKNEYSTIIASTPYSGKINHKRQQKAEQWVAWLLSPATQATIKNYRFNGQKLFYPIYEN